MNNDDLTKISKLLDDKLEPVQKELKSHSKILNNHTEILNDHGKILKVHGKLLLSLKRDTDTILKVLDKEQMEQRKRLVRVEKHLGISHTIL